MFSATTLKERGREGNMMKAIHFRAHEGLQSLVYEDAPKPSPKREGEALVRVHAVGVTPKELTWSTNWETVEGGERPQPVIPGHEFSGVIEEIKKSSSSNSEATLGEDVYGFTDFYRDGAEAEYAIALTSELAPKPKSLDYENSAAVPLSALTAWQALFDHGGLSSRQSFLVHGAAGGVGTFAVQLAHWAGANVIGTASARNTDFLKQLGANEVIDYNTTRFEEVVRNVDVVLDAVGGDIIQRSWKVLRKGGILVTIVGDPKDVSPEKAASHGVRALSFIVEPNSKELARIASLIDEGHVKPVIETVLPLSRARQAYERGQGGHTRDKVVLRVGD